MGGQLYNCEHFRFSGCSIRDCGENVFFLDGINSDNLFSTLAFLADRYNKAKKHDDGVEYIFVIRNEDLIDEILDNEPPMPYRIVLLDGDGPEGPRLRYLKK